LIAERRAGAARTRRRTNEARYRLLKNRAVIPGRRAATDPESRIFNEIMMWIPGSCFQHAPE
jgi:hypothetical protein